MAQKDLLRVLFPVFLILFILHTASADLQCDLASSGINDIAVLKLSSLTNAHSELPSQPNYPVTIFCEMINPAGPLSTSCLSTPSINFVDLSSITNAHAETGEWNPSTNPGFYSVDACIGASTVPDAFVALAYDPTKDPATCANQFGPGYDCIVTLSGIGNAHVAVCPQDQPVGMAQNAYDYQVCGYIGNSSTPPVPTDVLQVEPFNVGTQVANVAFSVNATLTDLLQTSADPLYEGSNSTTATITITDASGSVVASQNIVVDLTQKLDNYSLTFAGISLPTVGTFTASISVPPATFQYNGIPGQIETILANNTNFSIFIVNGTGAGQAPDDFVAIQGLTIIPSNPSNLDDVAIDVNVQNFASSYPEYGRDGVGIVGVLICQGNSLVINPVMNLDYVNASFNQCNPICGYHFDIDQTKLLPGQQYDVIAYASNSQEVSCDIANDPNNLIDKIPYTWGIPPTPVTENYLLNNISSKNLFINSGGGGTGAGTGDVFVIRDIKIQGLYEGDDYKATVIFNNLEQLENTSANLKLDLIDKAGATVYTTSLSGVPTNGPTLTTTIDIDETKVQLLNQDQPYTVSISIAPGSFNSLPETVLKNNLGFKAMPVLKKQQAFIIPETNEFWIIGILFAVMGMIYLKTKTKKNKQSII